MSLGKVVIWKFPIEINDEIVIKAPSTFHPLAVQLQLGKPCLWAMVDPEQASTEHHFKILGTGHIHDLEYLRSYEYLTAFQQGEFVWHVFWKSYKATAKDIYRDAVQRQRRKVQNES